MHRKSVAKAPLIYPIAQVLFLSLTRRWPVGILRFEEDRVLISKYAGNEVKIDGEDYIILREDDVLGIIKT